MANLWKGPQNRKRYSPLDFIPFVKRPREQRGAIPVRDVGRLKAAFARWAKPAAAPVTQTQTEGDT